MAENKKQHYVPKFYLRLFSIGKKGIQIKIFQKSTGKTINSGSIKNQAQENYFYGEDLFVEKWFSGVEGISNSAITDAINQEKLPKKNSPAYQILVLFILLQAFRTKAQVAETEDMVDSFIKAIMKHDDELKELDSNSFKISINQAPLRNLDALINGLPIMSDMELKMVSNKSATPFITSDHPVSKYNQFLESKKYQFGKTGMGCKGLQIFFPISCSLP